MNDHTVIVGAGFGGIEAAKQFIGTEHDDTPFLLYFWFSNRNFFSIYLGRDPWS